MTTALIFRLSCRKTGLITRYRKWHLRRSPRHRFWVRSAAVLVVFQCAPHSTRSMPQPSQFAMGLPVSRLAMAKPIGVIEKKDRERSAEDPPSDINDPSQR